MCSATPRIVLIFGASGSGKSTLLDALRSQLRNVAIHVKGTDRERKKYDAEEIRHLANVSPEEYDYIYPQYGNLYGIQKRQIDESLAAGKHHFIVCNDIATLHRIKRDYGERVLVGFLFFNAPREQIEAVQHARGLSDDNIQLRLAKILHLPEVREERAGEPVQTGQFPQPASCTAVAVIPVTTGWRIAYRARG